MNISSECNNNKENGALNLKMTVEECVRGLWGKKGEHWKTIKWEML